LKQLSRFLKRVVIIKLQAQSMKK